MDDSIGSLLNQTINLENIQIILVNDGSTDNSEEICLKYKRIHPKNIHYIKTMHGGVSRARNLGLKYAKGKYINFLDADDLWNCESFKYVSLFFLFHKNVDIVAGRLKFFEVIKSYHPLDYKFYKTRVVNLTEEYNCIQISGPSTFFRRSLIKGKKFPENVFSGEDTVFINNLLLLNPIIGYIKEAIYYYRRRSDSSSAVQTQTQKFDFYFSQLKYVGQYLLDRSKQLYNIIVPFIQFYIAYNDLFRILSPAFNFLSDNNIKEYCNTLIMQLKQIDDKYILEQKFTNYRTKLLALSKKYNRDVRYEVIVNNGLLMYYQNFLINITKSNNIIVWNILNIKDNTLQLEGKDNLWMPRDKYFYYCKFGDKIYFPKYYDYPAYDFYTMFGLALKGRIVSFIFPIEISDEQLIQFYITYNNESFELFPSFGPLTHLPPLKNGYYSIQNYIIKLNQKRLFIYKSNSTIIDYFENLYRRDLKNINKESLIHLRKNYFNNRILNSVVKKKEVWLINDSQDKAGDNGEYFFRYLKNRNITNIDYYYVIQKECYDYHRLKVFGNIIDLNSKIYLEIFLKSDKIITSISDSWVINPYKEDNKYLRDLFHFDLIFIQNGMATYDLSKNLNRINKNFSLLITSSKKEYNIILSSGYFYNKNNIVITGLPRFDHLLNLRDNTKIEKLILISPNWRPYIRQTIDLLTHNSIYFDKFKNTTFFNFYNNVINNKKIIDYMEKYNYTGLLCLPPYFSEQIIDFISNKLFKIKSDCNMDKLLVKASLLITDYSNIFFDFAYLKKPIIFYHFDIIEYRKLQFFNGNFDFNKDGFGPICYSVNCIADEIIKYVLGGCKLRKNYLKRVEKFFAFSDNNNSYRIYNVLIKKIKTNQYLLTEFIIFLSISVLLKLKILYKFFFKISITNIY